MKLLSVLSSCMENFAYRLCSKELTDFAVVLMEVVDGSNVQCEPRERARVPLPRAVLNRPVSSLSLKWIG